MFTNLLTAVHFKVSKTRKFALCVYEECERFVVLTLWMCYIDSDRTIHGRTTASP